MGGYQGIPTFSKPPSSIVIFTICNFIKQHLYLLNLDILLIAQYRKSNVVFRVTVKYTTFVF